MKYVLSDKDNSSFSRLSDYPLNFNFSYQNPLLIATFYVEHGNKKNEIFYTCTNVGSAVNINSTELTATLIIHIFHGIISDTNRKNQNRLLNESYLQFFGLTAQQQQNKFFWYQCFDVFNNFKPFLLRFLLLVRYHYNKS